MIVDCRVIDVLFTIFKQLYIIPNRKCMSYPDTPEKHRNVSLLAALQLAGSYYICKNQKVYIFELTLYVLTIILILFSIKL